jgi:RND family efflux transporter MFP subunit
MEKPSLDQLRIERSPEKPAKSSRKRLAVVTVVVMLAIVAVGYYAVFKPGSEIEVKTATARALQGQSATTVLNASGYVTARRQATVSSKFTGRVTEVLIEEGMRVEQGQVLARLDDSNIRASYMLAEAQWISTQRGLNETQTLLDEALVNFERNSRLVEQDLASEQELDRSRALSGTLAAQLERKKADVEVAARQLDIYRIQLEDTVIRAPFAGVVVAKNAQPGEMISPVSAGGGFTRTGIGTIVDMTSLEIEIDVNEAYINRVTEGQGVMATLDAYPDWDIPCHVIAIIPTADRQRATVEVRVGFDELDPRILPDMGVKVAFQEVESSRADSSRPAGVLIPQSAIRRIDGTDYVFVVEQGQVERRAVAAADTRGDDRLIASGLTHGERVVLDAPPEVVDGISVQEEAR